MAGFADTTTDPVRQTRTSAIAYPGTGDFSRADLVFTGVRHAGGSYEVRVFLNNPGATVDTGRDAGDGYAGRFHVFGHGGCFGDLGHCDVPGASDDPGDLRPPHQLTPLTTYLTVTGPLSRLLAGGTALATVTMLAVSLPPRRADRAPGLDLFVFDHIDLRIYRTPGATPP